MTVPRAAIVSALLIAGAACRGAASPGSATTATTVPVAAPDRANEAPPPTGRASSALVQIEMKHVHLHTSADVAVDVEDLRAEMVPRTAGQAPVFDDQRSFSLRVYRAEIEIDAANLANLLNAHVFAYEGAPLKDITIRFERGRLVQTAKLHKGAWVPVTMEASVAAAPDGRLRIHMESVKVAGVPSTKLLDLFGLKLDDVMSIKGSHGVEVQNDDVLVDVGQVMPPPAIQGRLTNVVVAGDRLRQTFTGARGATAPALRPPSAGTPNYVFFSGGRIQFGKLTMDDADLRLIDADARDPFDFFPDRYEDQLVAGYSKNTRIGGLETFMPDFNDLGTTKPLAPPRK